AVGVVWHEVGGPRPEGHVAAVGADRGVGGHAVALLAVLAHAHPGGAAVVAVEDEHVAGLVAVIGHQIGGVGPVGDEVAVGRQRRAEAAGVALGPARADA